MGGTAAGERLGYICHVALLLVANLLAASGWPELVQHAEMAIKESRGAALNAGEPAMSAMLAAEELLPMVFSPVSSIQHDELLQATDGMPLRANQISEMSQAALNQVESIRPKPTHSVVSTCLCFGNLNYRHAECFNSQNSNFRPLALR